MPCDTVILINILLINYLLSSAGKITILEYNKEGTKFVKLLQEAYGRSGCRREVPGQLLAADPKGRAIMVGMLCIVLLMVICSCHGEEEVRVCDES